jgi:hypothetical protein
MNTPWSQGSVHGRITVVIEELREKYEKLAARAAELRRFL